VLQYGGGGIHPDLVEGVPKVPQRIVDPVS